jgi:hypothetical protein
MDKGHHYRRKGWFIYHILEKLKIGNFWTFYEMINIVLENIAAAADPSAFEIHLNSPVAPWV